MSFKIITSNADETKALGKKLGSLLKSGDCVLLDGELGAGKTTFTQGIASALKIKGAETLLKESKTKLLDKSKRGNELYIVKGIFNQDAYFLKYTCPSTGRIYVSGIDPEIGKQGSADNSMAWKFQLEKSDYEKLIIEA